jgi:hypothetical protein
VELRQQALAQIARGNAERIEFLDDRQGFLDVFGIVVAVLGDFFERSREVAVFVEIADDDVRNLPHRFVANGETQLPTKMIAETLGR